MARARRYRRGFRAAIEAYKASKENRKLQQKLSIPTGKADMATGKLTEPWRPAARRAIRKKRQENANESDLSATSVHSRRQKKPSKKIQHEAAVEKARRTAVRAHFAACKFARADSVRQAHRAAVDAYLDDFDLGSLGEESIEVDAIEDAQSAAENLIHAYRSTILWYDNKDWQEVLARLSRYANDAHFYAKRTSEALEIAQRAANDQLMRAKFARVCSTLARERAGRASKRVVESANEAYLAAYEYARLRAKKGPRHERKIAHSQMRYAAKRIQIQSFNKSQNLRNASEQYRLRNISFSRWPFRLSFGLFKLSNFLWECVFLLIGFVIDAARGHRFSKEDWKADRRAFAAAETHAKKATEDPDPSLASATLSEFAVKYGAIDALVRNVYLAAEEEAEAAQSISHDAKKAADSAQSFAAYCRDFLDFAEYCATRADLHEARYSVDSNGRAIAPAALSNPDGDARGDQSIPRRAWTVFLRARIEAKQSLRRAKRVAERPSHQAGITGYASRPSYEASKHIHWLEEHARNYASPNARVLFVDARRRSERADLAGCSYYAACTVSFLSRAGAQAEDAVLARGKQQLRSKIEEALSLCEQAISQSKWAAEEAAELQQKLSVPDYAAATTAGLTGDFPRLTEYAQEATQRAQHVREALGSVLELNSSKASIGEVRAKAKEAAAIALGAAKSEHKARLGALSGLVSLHRRGIHESVALQRKRKRAFFERLDGNIRVAEHAETEGARIFKAAGLDYRVKEGLVERARQLREKARSEDVSFGTPWKDEFRLGTVPEQLESVIAYYSANRKQPQVERDKEIGEAIQGTAGQANGCVENLEIEFDELAEMIKCLEEIYGIARYFGDTLWIASNSKYFVREAIKYAREARDLEASEAR